MTDLLTTLLVVSLVWLAYTYVGYPVLLAIVASVRGDRRTPGDSPLPRVTVVTCAFNEAAVIGENIANKLALDYPLELVDMIVVSDESEDGTDEIVQRFVESDPERVRLIRQVPRQGKTSGLNLAVPEARGDVVVFADANSIFEPDALRRLVAPFGDPRVGYVTGKMIYTNPDGSVTGDGCTTYMRYENVLRDLETRVGSVVGVDGGVDAVRAELYRPMRADQLPDFVLPLRVVEQGYRVTFAPDAILREDALAESSREYRMRVRVSLRAMWALLDHRQLLDPIRFPVFSWQLASHKVLRYGAFLPQFVALASNALLVGRGGVFDTLFAAQIAFYVWSALGLWSTRGGPRVPLATAPYNVTRRNVACAHAAWKFVRGKKQVLWAPRSG